MALSESEALLILHKHLGATYQARSRGPVVLGIGDDCAIIKPSPKPLVWTTDSCCEDAHFRFDWLSPAELAHKSFHAAVSDVPAMGARPLGLNCQLTLTPRITRSYLDEFAAAQAALCLEHGVALLGGNVSWGAQLAVVLSVIGQLIAEPLLRNGAQAGDEIWLGGNIGLARAGYLLLERGRKGSRVRSEQSCLRAFRRPEAQLALGLRLVGRASACMDISDGLVKDTQNLASAAQVQLVLDAAQLHQALDPALLEACDRMAIDPLATALLGGEDYSLLACGPARRRPRGVRVIGHVRQGSGALLRCVDVAQAGALARALGSSRSPLAVRGDVLAGEAVVVLRGGFEHGAGAG